MKVIHVQRVEFIIIIRPHVRSFIHSYVRSYQVHTLIFTSLFLMCICIRIQYGRYTHDFIIYIFLRSYFSPIQTFDLNNECVNKSNESHRIVHSQNSNGTILRRANTRYSCTIQIDAFYLVTSFIILNKTRRFFNLTIHIEYLFVAFKNIWDMVLELQKNTRK